MFYLETTHISMRTKRKHWMFPFVVLLYGVALIFLYLYSVRIKYNNKTSLVFELEKCNCMRNLTTFSLNTTINFTSTTCGRDAYFRGSHQKVVAFSFYGNASSPSHLVRGFFQGKNPFNFLAPKGALEVKMCIF